MFGEATDAFLPFEPTRVRLCRRADPVLFQSRLEANSAITEMPLNWLLESDSLSSPETKADRKR
jgi:hypothetical protein